MGILGICALAAVLIGCTAGIELQPGESRQEQRTPVVVSQPSADPTASPAQETTPHGIEDVASLAATPEGAPPAPKGFRSAQEAHAAVASGQIAIIDRGEPLLDGVIETKDIEYGNVDGTRPLLLDLYQPSHRVGPAPGLIFIHGGGWKSGQRSDYRYYTMRFAQQGYVVATISYRLSGEATFPAAVQDVKCAVRWMRANAALYNVDPDKIALLGGSAGGYLAMMAGYAADVPEFEGSGGHSGVSSRVQAVVNLYGPTDLTAAEARESEVVKAFLGKNYDEDPDLYKKASPYTYLSEDDPPTLIFHGTVDQTVPVKHSDLLAAKLKELGIFYMYDRVEGWPHTMDLAREINDRCQFIIREFLQQVFAPPV